MGAERTTVCPESQEDQIGRALNAAVIRMVVWFREREPMRMSPETFRSLAALALDVPDEACPRCDSTGSDNFAKEACPECRPFDREGS